MMADLYRGIERFDSLDRESILGWLRMSDPVELEKLFSAADTVRRRAVGDEVHLRGLLEISNHCRRRCAYCGIRAPNRRLDRYRLLEPEILAACREAVRMGFGTVVLQSGEDPGIHASWLAGVIRTIKTETSLALTLSLGERTREELRSLREAGADRYLLRFETSDRQLYRRIHPPLAPNAPKRRELLRVLAELGYEVGSGVMIGIPGQGYQSLAEDILAFRDLNLDMIGVGPYLPHPHTPLGRARRTRRGAKGHGRRNCAADPAAPNDQAGQVPPTPEMTYKVLALSRLVCPYANIPSTTALATLASEEGRDIGLMRGANVIMPNLTPARYRNLYEIYPNKACLNETAEFLQDSLKRKIESIGRKIGTGSGSRIKSL